MGGLSQRVRVVLAVLFALLGIALGLTNQETSLMHEDEVTNFAWSHDGKLIATSSRLDRIVTVWSRDGTMLSEIPRPSGRSGSVISGTLTFSSNDDLIYTAVEGVNAGEAAVSVLDWKQGKWIRHLKAPPLPQSFRQMASATDFRVSPDGTKLLYVSGIYQFLTILSLPSGEVLALPHRLNIYPDWKGPDSDFSKYTASVQDLQWHPNSQEFAAMDLGGRPFIFEGSDFKKIDTPVLLFNGWKFTYSPNGRMLAVGKGYTFAGFTPAPDGAGSIAVIDRETLRSLGSKRLNDYKQPIRDIVFRNDNELFFSTYKAVYSLDITHLSQSEPKIFYRCSVICDHLHMSPDLQDLALNDGNDVIIRHLR